MNAIRENPYRTLGLFGNASEKELQKQIATIKRYAEVGKSKYFDSDFPFLGDFKREHHTVQQAASRIEQAKNKVHYSLFWFLNTNHIDEAALNHLKETNIDKATEIWEKLIKDNSITAKNYSAAVNLSTLQLGMTTLNGSFDPAQFQRSIELKGLIISSDAFMTFVQSVAGDNSNVAKDLILKEFVDEVLQIIKPYLNTTNGITSSKLIAAFSNFPSETKKYLSSKFTDKPLSNIETQVEKTKDKRTQNASDAEQYGEELYKKTKEDLAFLENVWGASNVQLQVVVNKVANEILQCSIDFFVYYRDNDEYNPGDGAMQLMKMAKGISPTGQIKSRVDENIGILQEWINDKPARERIRKVKDEIEFIGAKLEHFQKLWNTIAAAKELVLSCKPKLANMKIVLGSSDDFYLKVSSLVVNNAMGMIITVFNEEQSGLQYNRSKLLTLPATVSSAVEVISLMSGMDMVSELRTRFNENKNALSNINSQLSAVQSGVTSSSGRSGSGGCYIATMAYGSYEHPQVLQLRKFRDETLASSAFGRKFISTYYKVSPKLVELLQGKQHINSFIRTLLNAFIKLIK